LEVYLFGAVVAFVAGMVQGCAGFGLGMTSAPCLMLITTPAVAVPTILSLSLVNSLVVTLHARRHLLWRLVGPLALGSILGAPLGIYALRVLDPNLLKCCVAVLILLFAAALLAGWSRPLRRPHRALLPLGFFSGILGGSTSMSGPPVILFLTNQDTPKDVFRANLITYFFIEGVFTLIIYLAWGMYTLDVARFAVALVPAMLLGTVAGIHLSSRVPEQTFRRVVLVGITLMGVLLLITSLRALA